MKSVSGELLSELLSECVAIDPSAARGRRAARSQGFDLARGTRRQVRSFLKMNTG
jgi:hypothetical protein